MVSRVYWIFLLAAFVSLVAALPRPSNINKGRSRECGVHISAKRVKDAATRFRTFRLAPDSENATATLDIHFHVVYANTTFEGGYVPDKQIHDQVDVLNRDYNSTGIKWQLRSISRIESEDWFLGTAPDSRQEMAMKQLYRNGTKAALNVYTVGFQNPDAAGLLGIATFPMDYPSAPQSDGIMLLYSTLPGSAATSFNLGRTLVHEAGHWCGLYHTFQGGCDAPGDEVEDTPPEASPSKGCPVNRKTCPGTPGMDPVRNFMDYSDDACMDSFTRGQASRMRSHLRAYRGVDFK
jgi:hypothetical protein